MKYNLKILIITIALLLVGVRLYQRYIKKNTGNSDSGNKRNSSFSSSSKDDDYEPYMKKKIDS